jgi:hypothetical protein
VMGLGRHPVTALLIVGAVGRATIQGRRNVTRV